ncbi:MAG: hypothetical protein J6Y93_05920 [Treponema sp.]|nr:hypothetical protein [Treponema sp.]
MHAQNGISIDKMQEDPYFANGSAFNPDSKEEETVMPSDAQTYNPDDPETFYNSENWSGGIKKFEEGVLPSDQESFFKPGDGPDGTGDAENGKAPLEPQDAPDGEAPLKTDGQAGKDGSFNFASSRVNLSAGWNFQYSPTFLPSSFSSYFDYFFGFEFIGANARADWLLLTKGKLKFGVSAYGSWSWLYQKNDYTVITAHQYTADIFLTAKYYTEDENQLDFHLGGGFLGIADLKFSERKNELTKGPVSWRYLEVRAGAGYEMYVYDHFGFKFGADFAWAFMFENYYPRLEFSAGVAARF